MLLDQYLKTEIVLKKYMPELVKKKLQPIRSMLLDKHSVELSFWRRMLEVDSGKFKNSHYRKIILAIAEESNDSFVQGKVIADFGCGPRGSLVWAQSAALRIGIDVLADSYADAFKDNIISHGMVYLKSTEKTIPLPSNYLDIMFTLNAIDHVDNFAVMCSEIVRVIKPGGLFIGSFNLEEPASPCEPQRLNEQIIKDNLLKHLDIKSYRITTKGPPDDQYAPFFNNTLSYEYGQEGYLWVKAVKPN